MLVPYRHKAVDEGYRYGFQGQEKDDEIKGEGNSINFTFRMHDPRVGRFFAIDPLTKKYPWYTPYSFSGNKPIQFLELEGLEEYSPYLLNAMKHFTVLGLKNKLEVIKDTQKREKLGDAIENFETSYSYLMDLNNNTAAYALIRYAQGQGGYDIFNIETLTKSNTFSRGYKRAMSDVKSKSEELMSSAKTKTSYTGYVSVSQNFATYLEDAGSTLGSYGLKYNVEMRKIKNEEGEVSIVGSVNFTLADTYQWKPERWSPESTLSGAGNHSLLNMLKDIGAKDYSIRAYFKANFTYEDAFFSWDEFDNTKPEDITNSQTTFGFPEISKTAGYHLQPGGLQKDFRNNNGIEVEPCTDND